MPRSITLLHPRATGVSVKTEDPSSNSQQPVANRRSREVEQDPHNIQHASDPASSCHKKLFNRTEMRALLRRDIREHKTSVEILQSDTSKFVLHRYNEVKDTAQALMGLVAQQQGLSLKQVYEMLGIL